MQAWNLGVCHHFFIAVGLMLTVSRSVFCHYSFNVYEHFLVIILLGGLDVLLEQVLSKTQENIQT